MSSNQLVYLAWTPALVSRLLTCIISCGAHLNRNKWKEVADNFFSSNSGHREFYVNNPESYIRRVHDKFKEEYKRICMCMGWREYGGLRRIFQLKKLQNLEIPKFLCVKSWRKLLRKIKRKRKRKLYKNDCRVSKKRLFIKSAKFLQIRQATTVTLKM